VKLKFTALEENLIFTVQAFGFGDWQKITAGGPRLFRDFLVNRMAVWI
jgi:hypothetical protein